MQLRLGALAGVTAMTECVICEVFPDHKGSHYSITQLSARIRHARLRLGSASKWCELPGCFTAQNNPIMATAYMTEHPHAHSVTTGYWICEKDEDFEDLINGGTKREEADAVVDSSDEESEARDDNADVEIAVDLPTPEYDVGAGTQEGMKMANSGSQGYLTWSKSGLQADVSTNGGDDGGPDVAHLKKALRSFEPPQEVVVTVTEILGRGAAWVSLQVEPGDQARLLMSTGLVIDHLTNAGLCDEVVLTGNPKQ